MPATRSITLAVVSAAALVGLAPAAHAQISLVKCDTDGLHFESKSGGVTNSVTVRNLVAHNDATCNKATKIAKIVAKDILNDDGVPASVKGYAVTVTDPCAGCSPVYKVKAKKSRSNRITFKIAGGAS